MKMQKKFGKEKVNKKMAIGNIDNNVNESQSKKKSLNTANKTNDSSIKIPFGTDLKAKLQSKQNLPQKIGNKKRSIKEEIDQGSLPEIQTPPLKKSRKSIKIANDKIKMSEICDDEVSSTTPMDSESMVESDQVISVESEGTKKNKRRKRKALKSEEESEDQANVNDKTSMQNDVPPKKRSKKSSECDDVNDEKDHDVDFISLSSTNTKEDSFEHDGENYTYKIVEKNHGLRIQIMFEENGAITKHNNAYIKRDMVDEFENFKRTFQNKGRKGSKCIRSKELLLNLNLKLELFKELELKDFSCIDENLEKLVLDRVQYFESCITKTSKNLERQLLEFVSGATEHNDDIQAGETKSSKEIKSPKLKKNAKTRLNKEINQHDKTNIESDKFSNLNKSFDENKMEHSNKGGVNKKCFNCNSVGHISRDCPNSPKAKKTCNDCGSEDHLRKNCPERKTNFEKPVPKCFNCKETGHMSRDCPNEKCCDYCGSTEHMRKDCADKKVDSENSSMCYNCSEIGHTSRDCPNEKRCDYCGSDTHTRKDCSEARQGGGEKTKCYNCNEFGHISKDCPKKSHRSSSGGGKKCCDECGSEEHLRRDCPDRQSGSGSQCYNCKRTGHISRNCPDKDKRCCNECGSADHLRKDCPDRKDSDGIKCFNCNEMGHISRKCPSKSNERRYGSVKSCNECGSEDHLVRNCPDKKDRAANTKCFNCNNLGHISKDCPEEPKKKRCSECGSKDHLRKDCTGKVLGED